MPLLAMVVLALAGVDAVASAVLVVMLQPERLRAQSVAASVMRTFEWEENRFFKGMPRQLASRASCGES